MAPGKAASGCLTDLDEDAVKLTVPRFVLVLAFIFGAWWLTRPHGPPDDGAVTPEAGTSGVDGDGDRAMRARLELAVTSAANAAECGYTTVGNGYREPDEAAAHLVALMRSASAPPPGAPPTGAPSVTYVLDRPQGAWQVAVRLEAEGPTLVIEGYGPDLEVPLLRRRVPCS